MGYDFLFLDVVSLIVYPRVYREKPVFSTRAHVFQLDPQTKKNWKPASKTAILVAFYHDPARKTYRIISVDGGKVRLIANSQNLEC